MPGQLLKLLSTVAVAASAYDALVLAIPNLLAYWELVETSGANADDSGSNNLDGTYSGATLNNVAGPGASMGNAPLFDGINDRVTLPTLTGFSPVEGSVSAWFKVDAAQWTDGASRPVCWLGVNTNNRFTLTKHTVNNQFRFITVAGGTSTIYTNTTSAPTTWQHIAYTWKNTGNIISYLNGTQVDSQAWAGTWSGSAYTGEIGAMNFSSVWFSKWIAHVSVFTRQLTAGEITTLATAV